MLGPLSLWESRGYECTLCVRRGRGGLYGVGPLYPDCSVPRVLGQGDGAGVLGEHRVPYSCHHTFVLSDFLCLDGGRGSLG